MSATRPHRLLAWAPTVIGATSAGFVAAQKHVGFLIPVVVAALLAWWLVAWLLARRAARPVPGWRHRALRCAAWAIALGLAGATQAYWAHAARVQADAVAAAIVAHEARSGSFPSTLAQVGFDEQRLRHDWMLGYALEDGRPRLVYAATFTMFEGYVYDFGQRRWDFVPD